MLDDIGFYTLTEQRAMNTSPSSPMWRCELLVTDRCNFRCPYCRGFRNFSEDCSGDMPEGKAVATLARWVWDGLRNIRFSGGEPTLYPHLNYLVQFCQASRVERIAVSSNGSQPLEVYKQLIDNGVNDFSISLDACCATFGDKIAGVLGKWQTVVENIAALSKLTYVSVGCVFTPETKDTVRDVVEFAHSLGVDDIRIISAAQWDGLSIQKLPFLNEHPILKYRVNHFKEGRNVRGIGKVDSHKCYLVQDDSMVAGEWHFPCVIYLREGGEPIGSIGPRMRQERINWMNQHNSYEDAICQKNCLDVCIDYNNTVRKYLKGV